MCIKTYSVKETLDIQKQILDYLYIWSLEIGPLVRFMFKQK